MGTKANLSAVEKHEIIRLHDEGLTNQEISDKTGRSLPSIYRVIKSAEDAKIRKDITQVAQLVDPKCENLVRSKHKKRIYTADSNIIPSHDEVTKNKQKYFHYKKDFNKNKIDIKVDTDQLSSSMNNNFNKVDSGSGATIYGIYLQDIKKLVMTNDSMHDPVTNAILSQFDNNNDYDYHVYTPEDNTEPRFRYAVSIIEDNATEKHCIVCKNIDKAWQTFIDVTMKRKHANTHVVIILSSISTNEYDRLFFNTIAKSFSW